MTAQTIEKFNIIGISVRTTNENGQAGVDIQALWEKFMSGGMIEKIPNKVNSTLYCIYTDYEKDYTKPYTTILGCEVSGLDEVPEGMVGKTIGGGQFKQFLAKGDLMKGAVITAWNKIWEMDIPRAYTADFEVYGEKAQKPEDAEVDIFIAIH